MQNVIAVGIFEFPCLAVKGGNCICCAMQRLFYQDQPVRWVHLFPDILQREEVIIKYQMILWGNKSVIGLNISATFEKCTGEKPRLTPMHDLGSHLGTS